MARKAKIVDTTVGSAEENLVARAEPAAALDLKDACIEAAQAVIAEHGIEKLSLRDVARRLNVSHQAPYKHYPSRDHLLAEVLRRCFRRFTLALNGRNRSMEPIEDMRALGASYLNFALQNPLEYRLMFGTPWPEVEASPDLLVDSRHSFNVLREALTPLYAATGASADEIDTDAMFVWSSMHGLATILQSQVMRHLDLNADVMHNAAANVMHMVDMALMSRIQALSASKI
ncbi:MAG: TetR family transcriptional regulator [Burkholderiales bacterium PBB4]|nr:MAG: TetR family transcriptional regulator [Burkholderiales bacterium PBB4]